LTGYSEVDNSHNLSTALLGRMKVDNSEDDPFGVFPTMEELGCFCSVLASMQTVAY